MSCSSFFIKAMPKGFQWFIYSVKLHVWIKGARPRSISTLTEMSLLNKEEKQMPENFYLTSAWKMSKSKHTPGRKESHLETHPLASIKNYCAKYFTYATSSMILFQLIYRKIIIAKNRKKFQLTTEAFDNIRHNWNHPSPTLLCRAALV